MADTKDRPVLTGLIALAVVAAVVGIIGGLAALVGSRVMGLDGDAAVTAQDQSSSDASLYLPEPTITSESVTPNEEASPTAQPSNTASAAASEITLAAAQATVAAMQQIDLSGSFPAGEGAVLQVQQKVGDGEWRDFPVTMQVSNQTFGGYIQTGQPGVNTFRVTDTDKGISSNEVVVTVG